MSDPQVSASHWMPVDGSAGGRRLRQSSTLRNCALDNQTHGWLRCVRLREYIAPRGSEDMCGAE